MTIALMNTEKGYLRLTTALSAAESWWNNGTSKRMAHLRQVWCRN
nr:MAG TPA: hypothetical protein [Bacteriophage sp.]